MTVSQPPQTDPSRVAIASALAAAGVVRGAATVAAQAAEPGRGRVPCRRCPRRREAIEADARPPPRADQVIPGTSVFVNPVPPRRRAPPGPEEASLNFEGLDVREVAKVILGDYLKESYTVHPAVAGTVTFRTIKPIPRKELLPTLEMLLRQNSAALVIEEGVYKILPIAAVRGSVSPQLGGVDAADSAGILGGRGAAQVRRRARDGQAARALRRRQHGAHRRGAQPGDHRRQPARDEAT